MVQKLKWRMIHHRAHRIVAKTKRFENDQWIMHFIFPAAIVFVFPFTYCFKAVFSATVSCIRKHCAWRFLDSDILLIIFDFNKPWAYLETLQSKILMPFCYCVLCIYYATIIFSTVLHKWGVVLDRFNLKLIGLFLTTKRVSSWCADDIQVGKVKGKVIFGTTLLEIVGLCRRREGQSHVAWRTQTEFTFINYL